MTNALLAGLMASIMSCPALTQGRDSSGPIVDCQSRFHELAHEGIDRSGEDTDARNVRVDPRSIPFGCSYTSSGRNQII